jgi:hypothetical protein
MRIRTIDRSILPILEVEKVLVLAEVGVPVLEEVLVLVEVLVRAEVGVLVLVEVVQKKLDRDYNLVQRTQHLDFYSFG